MLLSAVMCAKPLRHRNVNIKLYINQIYVNTIHNSQKVQKTKQATKKKISTSDYLRNEFIGHVNTSELSISSSLYLLFFYMVTHNICIRSH
jgi:hypothetical protein